MNKLRTTQSESERVEAWIEEKRSENKEMMQVFKLSRNMKWLVSIQKNSELICMAEKHLANHRVFTNVNYRI